VVIPGFLREMLAAHLARNVARDPDSLVFTNAEGGPLRNSNFRSRVWRPALAAAGLPEDLRIHDLRHTCAALLIAQGAHPKAIQAQLGHSSIQVTLDRYGHLFPDDMDGLATQLDAPTKQLHCELRPLCGLGQRRRSLNCLAGEEKRSLTRTFPSGAVRVRLTRDGMAPP
jgi:hypothetical protein